MLVHQSEQLKKKEMAELAQRMHEISKPHNLRIAACCESPDLSEYGIERSACIDQQRIESIIGCPLTAKKDANQRNGCGCCESFDIGAYDTCLNHCVYCYANVSYEAAFQRNRMHNSHGELLIGAVREGEGIKTKMCATSRKAQISFFD